MSERPLVTFLLMAYRQEQFIADAVAAALAQTYQPLEIILTDDCSPDGTFRIMSEMAGAYQGPHKIVLNRNPVNLGIGAHMNFAVQSASGELIVDAAGDDISDPTRVERVVTEWERHGRIPCSIYSDGWVIDQEGTRIRALLQGRGARHTESVDEAIQRRGCGVPGCSHAFSRKLFELFGPLPQQLIAEDLAIPFRSLLLGKIIHLDQPLISYRVHDSNVSIDAQKPTVARRHREAVDRQTVLQSWSQDIETARCAGLLGAEEAESLLKRVERLQRLTVMESDFFGRGAVSGLLPLMKDMIKNSAFRDGIRLLERRLRSR